MTRVIFETASFADSIKKAARIAPVKGAALDKSPGIVLEIDPTQIGPITLKATDTSVWYTELLDTVESTGDARIWRIPSLLLNSVVSSFPIGSNQTVVLDDDNGSNTLHVLSGKTRARINLISADAYPEWKPFNPDTLQKISGLGIRMARVAWAVSTAEEPFTGIHLTGSAIVATDKYRFATMPLELPLSAPVTIPFRSITDILKNEGDIRIGVTDSQVLFMPDDVTQIRAGLYGQKYVDVHKFMDGNRNRPDYIKVGKAALKAMVDRCEGIVRTERFPKLFLTVGNEEVVAFLSDATSGDITDSIDIPGQALHEPCRMLFTPKNLSGAIEACPADEIMLGYNAQKPLTVLYINGGNDYESWVVPRRETGE